MTAKIVISGTRSFAADADGMPVSRQLTVDDQAEPQAPPLHATEQLQRAYLAATGVEAIDHKPPTSLAEAYLIATGVLAAGSTSEPDWAEPDPLGAAWVGATTSGWCP